jgi:arsenite methyltransferase
MADLRPEPTSTASCCSTEAQANCCEPSDKAECCETTAADGACGCSAAGSAEPAADIRETVRQRYAEAAVTFAAGASSCGCDTRNNRDATGAEVFGGVLYDADAAEGATEASVLASLGCGVPTAVADLHEGETVLDLGSGAGADVLISAKRVGASGRAIGLDMTDEMLELARANAAAAGVTNVEFVKGYIEDIPLASGSVDVIVSNCVLNLSGDKARVFAEAARVLKPGGRFAVSDVVASPDMDDTTRADMQHWTGCIAGALTEQEFRHGLAAVGFSDIEVRETHPVHAYATAAIIRARKPGSDAGASADTAPADTASPPVVAQVASPTSSLV